MRSLFSLKSSTLTFTLSPSATISDGWLTRPHDMSVIWSRPSNAAQVYERRRNRDVLDHAVAQLASFLSSARIFSRCWLRSSLEDDAARHHECCGAPLFTLITRNLKVLADKWIHVRECWRKSICEPGQKPFTPNKSPTTLALDLPAQDAPRWSPAFQIARYIRVPYAQKVGAGLRKNELGLRCLRPAP